MALGLLRGMPFFAAQTVFASFVAISTSGCVWPGFYGNTKSTNYNMHSKGRKWRVFSTISAHIKYVLLCNLATRVNKVCTHFIHGMNFCTAIVTGGK